MTVIRPLSLVEFEVWRTESIPSYAAEKVASGAWPENGSLELAQQDHDKLLPQGLGTPENYFFAILDSAGAQVGTIWFAIQERGGARVAYIYDVNVWPQHQRQGHASRAFLAVEDQVSRLGLSGIALHVFGHNTGAQALYAKLGYEATNINMFKRVATDA